MPFWSLWFWVELKNPQINSPCAFGDKTPRNHRSTSQLEEASGTWDCFEWASTPWWAFPPPVPSRASYAFPSCGTPPLRPEVWHERMGCNNGLYTLVVWCASAHSEYGCLLVLGWNGIGWDRIVVYGIYRIRCFPMLKMYVYHCKQAKKRTVRMANLLTHWNPTIQPTVPLVASKRETRVNFSYLDDTTLTINHH